MKQRTRLACLAATLVFAGVALADQARAPTGPLLADAQDMSAVWTSTPAGKPDFPRVGETIDPGQLHPVRRPGLYGVSEAPDSSRYGIADGRLIRYDPTSLRVQSVIRQVDEIVD
mgnify:CR=1 FL=1